MKENISSAHKIGREMRIIRGGVQSLGELFLIGKKKKNSLDFSTIIK